MLEEHSNWRDESPLVEEEHALKQNQAQEVGEREAFFRSGELTIEDDMSVCFFFKKQDF